LEAQIETLKNNLKSLEANYENSQKICIEDHVSKALLENVNCKECPNLHEEILSLKCKLEHASSWNTKFAKNINFSNPFGGTYKNFSKPSVSRITCHYCCKKGHTLSKCYIRKYHVPNGRMTWVPKSNNFIATNEKDPIRFGYL